MADNDELQQSLDTLGRHVRDLTRQMNRTGAQITSLNKTVGDLVAQNKNKKDVYTVDEVIPRSSDLRQLLDSFDTVLRKYADDRFRNKSGDINGTLLNKLHRRIEQVYNATSFTGRQQLEALNIGSSNPYKWSDTQQGYDSIRDSISAGLKDLKLPAIASKELYSMLGVGGKNVNRINLDERVKVSYDEYGLPKEFINMDSDFAKLRDDVVALRRTLGETSKEVQTSNSHFTALSTNLQDLVDKSKTLNDIFEKINTSSTTLQNTSLPGLTTAVGDARTAMNNFVSGQNNALKSLNKSINNTIKTQQTVTNQIMQTAQKQAQQTQTGSSGNTFSRQVQKNDERARQAGFIAMLIPALAKLIEKTPFSDFIKVAGLMIGKFMPEIGALVASLAPLIGASILTKGGSSLVKMFTGRGAGKLAGGALKGRGIFGMASGLPWAKRKNYLGAFWKGIKKPNSFAYTPKGIQLKWGVWDSATNKLINPVAPKDYALANQLSLQQKYARLGSRTPALEAEAYLRGSSLARNFPRRMSVGVGRFTKPFRVAGSWALRGLNSPVTRAVGRGLPYLAALASLSEEFTDGKWERSVAKHGTGKGRALQGAKSLTSIVATGGIAALTGGASLLFTPIIKGLIDGLINNNNKRAQAMADSWKKQWNVEGGFWGKVFDILAGGFQGVKDLLSPITWIWNKLKGLPIFGGDTGKNSPSRPMPGSERDIVNKSLNDAKKQYKENLAALKREQKEYEQIAKYYNSKGADTGFGGFIGLGSNKIAYENKMRDFRTQYAQAKIGVQRGDETLSDYGVRLGRVRDSKEAEEYAKKQMDAYMKNTQQQLKVRSEVLKNTKSINPANLVSQQFLLSHTKSQVERELASRPDAYERLTGRAGIYSVDYNSFKTDAAYAGRGVQDQLANILTEAGLAGRGVRVTSGMGTMNGPHSKGGSHYNSLGNTFDINLHDYNTVKSLIDMQRAGKISGLVHGVEALKGYGQSVGATYRADHADHTHFTVTNAIASANAKLAAAQVKTEQATATAAKTSTASLEASSEVREGLLKAIGEKKREDKTARARNIIFSAVDVTGSLGVWGITQINNTGRDAGRMRTGI